MLTNLKTAYAEAREIHLGSEGYFAILSKSATGARRTSRQTMYRMEHLEAVASSTRSSPDTYISQASFCTGRSRGISNVASIGCAFVDLDSYKMGLDADDRLVEQLVEKASQLGLPEPSYIVASGRGLNCKWLFDAQLPAAWLDRWQNVQSILVQVFRTLGADTGVRDAARVLRLVETSNSANGQIVRVVWSGGQRIPFERLWTAVSGIDLSTLQEISGQKMHHAQRTALARRVKALGLEMLQSDAGTEAFQDRARQYLERYASEREPIMLFRKNLQSLNWSRFIDLRDLCIRRGGPRRGSRDVTLFWMMNFLALSGVVTPENFQREVTALSASFEGVGHDFHPLDGSLNTLCERVGAYRTASLRGDRQSMFAALYTPTNETLIDLLEISSDEQRELRTVIGAAEVQRRRDAKVPGREERRSMRQSRTEVLIARVQALESQQVMWTCAALAEEVGVSRSSVSRILAKAKLTSSRSPCRQASASPAEESLRQEATTVRRDSKMVRAKDQKGNVLPSTGIGNVVQLRAREVAGVECKTPPISTADESTAPQLTCSDLQEGCSDHLGVGSPLPMTVQDCRYLGGERGGEGGSLPDLHPDGLSAGQVVQLDLFRERIAASGGEQAVAEKFGPGGGGTEDGGGPSRWQAHSPGR